MALKIPAFLLRHLVTIEPYAGTWGVYGAPVAGVRCAKEEKLGTATTPAGVARYASVSLVFRPDVAPLLTEGSRITLGDGRRGYAGAVAVHTGDGLPTPDHVAVALVLPTPDHVAVALVLPAPSYGAPLTGETVVVLHRVPLAETDRYGAVQYRTEPIPVQAASVRVVGSDERGAAPGTSVVDTIEVVLPPGTPVAASARLLVRGLTYEVLGTPDDVRDQLTGSDGGIKATARRVSG